MTAQANIILKNLLMPQDKPEFQRPATDANAPKLLGKCVYELNMVYLCSLGRLMAMLSEKTQTRGILGIYFVSYLIFLKSLIFMPPL